jgi:hypothetical protein
MLYCKRCMLVIETSRSACPTCEGAVLICGTCNQAVPAGSSFCSNCEPVLSLPLPGAAPAPPTGLVRANPLHGIPALASGLPGPVSSGYRQNRFGVEAQVQLNGRDAEILTKMRQTAALLHVLAQEINNLQGHMQSTRALIKSCRNLANDLQEEVEVRLGPQG